MAAGPQMTCQLALGRLFAVTALIILPCCLDGLNAVEASSIGSLWRKLGGASNPDSASKQSDRAEFEDRAKRIAGDTKTIILTGCTEDHVELFSNFGAHLGALSFAPRMLVLTGGSGCYDYVESKYKGQALYKYAMEEPGSNRCEAMEYIHAIELVATKVQAMRDLVGLGLNVLYSSVDMVWLKDPFPLFQGDDLDLFLTDDGWSPLGATDPTSAATDVTKLQTDNIGWLTPSFLYLRPTEGTTAFLDTWLAQLKVSPYAGLDNEPPQFNSALLESIQASSKPLVGVLPQRSFPPGWLFFGGKKWREEGGADQVVALHNNWIVDIGLKKQRLVDTNLWKGEEMTVVVPPPGSTNSSRTSAQEFENIVRSAGQDGKRPVIMTMANSRDLTQLLNWMLQLVRLELVDQAVVIAEDPQVYRKIEERWPCHAVWGLDANAEHEGVEGGPKKDFAWRRPKYLLEVLRLRIPVFYVDTDMVWASNPMDFFTHECDFYVTNSGQNPLASILTTVFLENTMGVWVTPGLLYFRPTAHSINAVAAWAKMPHDNKDATDQKHLNSVVARLLDKKEVAIGLLPQKVFPPGWYDSEKGDIKMWHMFDVDWGSKVARWKELNAWLVDDLDKMAPVVFPVKRGATTLPALQARLLSA